MIDPQAATTKQHKLKTSDGAEYEFHEIPGPQKIDFSEEPLNLEQSNALRGLLSVHQDFVYSFGPDFRLTFANPALLALWGLSLDEIVGKNFADLGYPQSLIELHQAQLNIAFSGNTIRGENDYRNASGQYGYYEYIFTPIIKPDGTVESVVGVTRDITHRKQLEDERERLLDAIVHDLRSPLSTISMGTHLLEQDPDPEVVKLIQSNTKRALRLVEDLLDSSRLRAGESLQLRLADCDLRKLCLQMAEEFKILYSNRIDLELPPEDTPCTLSADKHAIQRILANLTTNAAKYGVLHGPITIALDRPSSRELQLSVSNRSDSPISPQEFKQFFVPFWRAEGRNGKQKEQGWGIGLSTSAQLAKAHGGNITAQSAPKTGTTFTLSLPISN